MCLLYKQKHFLFDGFVFLNGGFQSMEEIFTSLSLPSPSLVFSHSLHFLTRI